jgi:hypothetical protein
MSLSWPTCAQARLLRGAHVHVEGPLHDQSPHAVPAPRDMVRFDDMHLSLNLLCGVDVSMPPTELLTQQAANN